MREWLAEAVFVAANVCGAALVVAIAVRGGGPWLSTRVVLRRKMMLAAWSEGVGACPNGMPDPGGVGRVLGLEEGERPVIVLTFGYPARARDPQRRSPEGWIAGADRESLEEVVRRL